MKRPSIVVAMLAVILASNCQNYAHAHDGHGSSPNRDPEINPRGTPIMPRRLEVGPEVPRSFGPDFRDEFGENPGEFPPVDANPRTYRKDDDQPRDLRTLAIRLEFAAEIVSDEISFDLQHSR